MRTSRGRLLCYIVGDLFVEVGPRRRVALRHKNLPLLHHNALTIRNLLALDDEDTLKSLDYYQVRGTRPARSLSAPFPSRLKSKQV